MKNCNSHYSLLIPRRSKYSFLTNTTQTINTQDTDKLSIIQLFLPMLKIRNVRIIKGYWEALVTLKYPLDGSTTKWYKVRDLIEEFKNRGI